jgi:hypothetical protein
MIPRLRMLEQRAVPGLPRCRADDLLERQISKRGVRCRHAIKVSEPLPLLIRTSLVRELGMQLPAVFLDRALVRCVHREEVSRPAQHEDDESNDENGSEYAAADIHVDLR